MRIIQPAVEVLAKTTLASWILTVAGAPSHMFVNADKLAFIRSMKGTSAFPGSPAVISSISFMVLGWTVPHTIQSPS